MFCSWGDWPQLLVLRKRRQRNEYDSHGIAINALSYNTHLPAAINKLTTAKVVFSLATDEAYKWRPRWICSRSYSQISVGSYRPTWWRLPQRILPADLHGLLDTRLNPTGYLVGSYLGGVGELA